MHISNKTVWTDELRTDSTIEDTYNMKIWETEAKLGNTKSIESVHVKCKVRNAIEYNDHDW